MSLEARRKVISITMESLKAEKMTFDLVVKYNYLWTK